MNKRIKIVFAVTVVLAMVLSACAPKPTEAPPEPTATEPPVEEKTKVAVLFPGVVTDQSWNQFGYEGLVRAEKECGVEIGYSEDVSQDEQIETIRNYVAEGYDMIIGHGGEYEDALATVAGEYPDIQFGVTDGAARTPNMSATKLSFRQMGYLAGILACEMTETDHVAYVVGELVGGTDEGIEGYKLGIATCGKDIEVDYIATGDWADVAMAREAGLALIDDGVDVLWHMLDTADAGLISAAEDRGVWAIGLYRDSSPLGPNVVLGSTLGSPGVMIHELACGKGVPGETIPVSVNTTNGVDVSLTDLTPTDVQQKVLDALEKMRSGELYVEP
ncbi:MAG: BMP family protein [Anaerolineae bacterium]|nr:BMP family protein [Anaerolineae bacterium]